MKRAGFLKSIIGGVAVAAIPIKVQAAKLEKEYSFDEIFHQPYGNENLFYPRKDCEIYVEIKKRVGEERILSECKFRAYLGYHQNLIPIKKTYTISDFMPFVLAANSYYKKNDVFAEWESGVFFRLIKERGTDTMYFDTFLAEK